MQPNPATHAPTSAPTAREGTLRDPALIATIQHLRQTDNLTNWWFILRTYAVLAVVIGGTLAASVAMNQAGWSAWWQVPIYAIAIVIVGACQHQLSGLAHEGVHHTLFKHRKLNDLASDWFCMFPLFSSTHHYRLQHLAHHQFVNDPDRDPDISQLKSSGHWLGFPVSKREFVRTILKQMWVPNLIRFMRIRAQYNATGTDQNPYLRKGVKPSKVAVRIGVLYILIMVISLTVLTIVGNPLLLAVIPGVLWLGMIAIFSRLPADKFHQSRVHPVISLRVMTLMRLTFITALFASLAWITLLTGRWAALDFFLLWVVPIMTSFAFFMILRQLVQHGNGDRGWTTNTRTFLQNPLVRYAVFPMGQDYHLPHHMYASVPHFRLAKLHDALMQIPEYSDEATVVEGYFRPRYAGQVNPTVLDIVTPEYAPHSGQVFVDDSVLEQDEVEDKEQILKVGEELRQTATKE
ncbi:fatty acid desaturase family protein [Tuwongella immobilis]|uniref:Fatty acid desaturase domain-containing protein n=1 Tax=Tuwongella immobilis TaxID=692036 RepID=A0A6C2YRZ5_9BACT|nr:fatty acid desaturase [Tuwongella immobilis]VIP04131.1 fatty acid desaturase : Fatty acid desaturase OS=Hyphomicrobium denitrificans (strain ATCC 51888 / DSM 1869 / NCIB 11706 / TK 0415) GN=Hden_2348 PE=4 SV=1: FA_desaturase: FA_desaturase [Tuwongella immobilis]VTS05627.1 fatty acid desaturase : Fatty acid desaturase OS=Hyphomicrobium denitrificans (strain ATCC 51888 / DSM 1869 / NCIB 11706 / TK 0415) GN=Hden_2348 PE=4 SV=1: FA_desaturase: FA_desaturase [Tuwongella immobilis]